MEPLQPKDVQAALKALGLEIEIRFFEESTATSQEAADQIGCELGQIVKSLGFMVDERPVLVLASGDVKIDDRKLAAIYEVARKKVKVATPEQLIALFGYAPGCMAPFGLRTPNLPIYIESALSRYELVYAAGGATNAIFPIPLRTLQEKTGGTLTELRKDA